MSCMTPIETASPSLLPSTTSLRQWIPAITRTIPMLNASLSSSVSGAPTRGRRLSPSEVGSTGSGMTKALVQHRLEHRHRRAGTHGVAGGIRGVRRAPVGIGLRAQVAAVAAEGLPDGLGVKHVAMQGI